MLFISNVQRLKNYWLSHGVTFNTGASKADLAGFEHRFGVSLPYDLRDYFLTVNGMPEEATDNEMIRFWMLEEVKPLTTGAPSYAKTDYVTDPESLFLFADHSLWAHAYAIRLFASAEKDNEIFMIGGDCPIRLFRSFGELIDSYLTNKDLMFGPSSLPIIIPRTLKQF